MTSHITSRLRGSRPVVGSSRKITDGCATRLAARSRRRRIPPEYVATRRRAASLRSKRVEQFSRPRARGGTAEPGQPAHHAQVLVAGLQLVDRGVLARQADRVPDRALVLDDVEARYAAPGPRPRAGAWRGSAPSSSCRRRWGRAARRPCRARPAGRRRPGPSLRRRTSRSRSPRSPVPSCRWLLLRVPYAIQRRAYAVRLQGQMRRRHRDRAAGEHRGGLGPAPAPAQGSETRPRPGAHRARGRSGGRVRGPRGGLDEPRRQRSSALPPCRSTGTSRRRTNCWR